MIKIVPFENIHAVAFKQLNLEWLEAYNLYEPADLQYLDAPQSNILEQGGRILIAIKDNVVIGTCAIIMETSDTAELAKLAVSPDAQGKGVGRMLAMESVKEARKMGLKKIFLVSNKKLDRAIRLYESFGFSHMPVPKDTIYKTADVYMEMIIN
ncbi:MAG: GNAT family N-acetyltransferase [Desulfobacula sp.]|nr:GNAT family N-acetyltransferase [Desulfobacula sp.]